MQLLTLLSKLGTHLTLRCSTLEHIGRYEYMHLRSVGRSVEMQWRGDLLLSKIIVGFVDPVGPRGMEDVQVHGVLERLSFVRHMRRDRQHLARVHDDFLSVDPELQRAFKNVAELFVLMAVQRDDAASLEQHAREHHLIADNQLALKQRIYCFQMNFFPG